MLDRLIIRFISRYMDKHNNKITYRKKGAYGGEYVIRKFTRVYYEDSLDFRAGRNLADKV